MSPEPPHPSHPDTPGVLMTDGQFPERRTPVATGASYFIDGGKHMV